MGRGILSGLIWGSIISVAVLGTVSQLTPLPVPVAEATGGDATADVPTRPEAEAASQEVAKAPAEPVQAEVAQQDAQSANPDKAAPVSPLMESPEAETVPEPAADPDGSETARSVETASGGVELPAGSEFRKALPETEAALPGSAGAPMASHAPMAPPPEAEDGGAALALDPAPRPATPGMSVTAPAAPNAQVSDSAALAIPPELSTTPDAPAIPAPKAVDSGDSAPATALSKGFPPPTRPETVAPEDIAAAATALEQIDTSAPEARVSPEAAEAAATAMAETVTAGGADAADRVSSETAPAAEAESLSGLSSQAGEPAPVPVPDVAAVEEAATTQATPAEATLEGAQDAVSADAPPEVSDLAPRVPPVPVPTGSAEAVTGSTESTPAVSPAPEATESAAPADPAQTAEADRLNGTELASAPTTGLAARVRPLTERTGSSARLPQVGAAAPEAAEAAVDAVDTADAEIDAEAADAPRLDALVRNARPFENPDGKPLFSVILIDDGTGAIDRAVLGTFTFPVSFAIDPTRPEARVAAEELSAAGFEIVALATGLPDGATPGDVETTLESHLAQLPQAVAVMDLAENGLAGRRQLAQQALTFAARDGHGVLGWSGGLGPLEAAARKGDAPVALVYRALDNQDERSPTIRRYLDRAAFKAAQDGSVIMVGRARLETVTALFEWALGGKSGQVALAPVSAVLRQR
ncbi:divergent polysaccharide deacetylase family protein [Tropicimonas sp. TH_r6]|uniref:divergent polysaccharide deacetylase family protein n=1 Tax=Tropicimonas sp. TH_r6 TaxID=3082085 RepID=UPI002953893C|nr:divergent polysaccharide deacetylase family protein [Tropicimonas sp. TH_r6]MDV7141893.1 divergent polysaccharide deacetylase family protein [Tropicimonas sp. TH_r6]